MSTEAPLLDVQNLSVRHGAAALVDGVSFALGRERLGIVGESGSGKSLTGRSILGLLQPPLERRADRLDFDGIDLLSLSEAAYNKLRCQRIGLILQDPRYALNPVMRVGRQIAEVAQIHLGCDAAGARHRALRSLSDVQISDPERVYDLYPHEVSGGMGQRVMIAMMLLPEPDLLIADEPTSALDVHVQVRILTLLDRLVMERNMGLLFISHDLRLVSSFCDRVLVMQKGRAVELLAAGAMDAAQHPYTQALMAAVPRLRPTIKV